MAIENIKLTKEQADATAKKLEICADEFNRAISLAESKISAIQNASSAVFINEYAGVFADLQKKEITSIVSNIKNIAGQIRAVAAEQQRESENRIKI